MTAEIVIMNKSAVALAADSAVTIGKDQKIYNTVNKVFTLSKYEPVGIMVYGGADLMEVPWETAIKSFREQLGRKKFNTVKQYGESFIRFLENNRRLFPANVQKMIFFGTVYSYLIKIKETADAEVKKKLDCDGKISRLQAGKILEKTIQEHFNKWKSYKGLKTATKNREREITAKYKKLISKIRKEIFQKQTISRISQERLNELSAFLFTKDNFLVSSSGIVITGFGAKESYPAIISYEIESITANKLKYRQDIHDEITYGQTALIVPFAQTDTVSAFIDGLDPKYRRLLTGYLTGLFDAYPKYILQSIGEISDRKKKELSSGMKIIGEKMLDAFIKEIFQFQKNKFSNPITSAVAVLPKDELGVMAESLVHLTAIRRKFSLDAETVGGPIDVAIISKGDGFVWIKRKHYFKPELNHHFFVNYFRGGKPGKGKVE